MAKKVREVLQEPNLDQNILSKVLTGRKEMTDGFIERSDEVMLGLVGTLTGRHVMFVGEPGTGKSLLARVLAEFVQGNFFDFQFNKFTDPAEVFGPLSVPHLIAANGGASQYLRVTAGMLPEAHVAHFDELGKASTAILNTLLRALNEGTFTNNGQHFKLPLLVGIASANEWLGADENAKEQGALFDRFTFRRTVKRISTPAGRRRLLFDDNLGVTFTQHLTPTEVLKARAEIGQIPLTTATMDALDTIITTLAANGINPGDRRQRWAKRAIQGYAYICGSARAEPEHLEILSHVLWSEPVEQPVKAEEIIMKIANPAGAKITKLVAEADEIIAKTNTNELPSCVAAKNQLIEIKEKLELMKDSDRQRTALGMVDDYLKNLMRAVMEKM